MKKEKGGSQLEAASHIKRFLAGRGLNLPSKNMKAGNSEDWLVFEQGQRRIGIDPEAGVWRKDSPETDWQCIEKPCTVSGALLAADFLSVD